MNDVFFKFPSTPHIVLLRNVEIRDDKVLSESERNEFLRNELVIEEKVDGANLGISFDSEGNIRLQVRGAYLFPPFVGQWKKLAEWLHPRFEVLFDHLVDQFILFGEWCFAQHSISYNRLPDWFLGFDVYDKSNEKFFSTERRNAFFEEIGIDQVPLIGRGHYSLSGLKALFSKSEFGDSLAEGLYLRLDHGKWLVKRAKIVHPIFIQSIEQHWSKSQLRTNCLQKSKPNKKI